jgi:hypothetical protein
MKPVYSRFTSTESNYSPNSALKSIFAVRLSIPIKHCKSNDRSCWRPANSSQRPEVHWRGNSAFRRRLRFSRTKSACRPQAVYCLDSPPRRDFIVQQCKWRVGQTTPLWGRSRRGPFVADDIGGTQPGAVVPLHVMWPSTPAGRQHLA